MKNQRGEIITGLVVLIMFVSGIGAVSGLKHEPLSVDEILQVAYDCRQSGLEYDNKSNVSIPQTVIVHTNLSKGTPAHVESTFMWTEQDKIDYQMQAIRDLDGINIFFQWCEPADFHNYQNGKQTLFKPEIEHLAMINNLIKCRRQAGFDNEAKAEVFATMKVDAFSGEITEVACI